MLMLSIMFADSDFGRYFDHETEVIAVINL